MKTIDVDDVPDDWPPDPGKRGRRRKPQGLPRVPKLAVLATGLFFVIAFFAIAMAVSGRLGFVNISEAEVGVKVNYLTGSKTVITTPGVQVYIPFLEEVFALDRTPQKFLMEGTKDVSENHVSFLTVRAKDGSNFWFESLEIQYALTPGMADRIIEDSGPGDGFKRDWIRALARSMLRDEFGKLSAVEVADPTRFQTARVESTRRLNELLNPHGIEVIQIITPKPRFDAEYEQAIEDRKEADQDVERLAEEANRLTNERERRLSKVEKEKEIEWTVLLGDLTKAKLGAEREAIEMQKAADEFRVKRTADGEAERSQMLAEADGLTVKYQKEAEGILARARALEKRGRVVVREALIEKLSSIRFTLVPYSKDPEPRRLEHEGLGAPAARAAGSVAGGERR